MCIRTYRLKARVVAISFIALLCSCGETNYSTHVEASPVRQEEYPDVANPVRTFEDFMFTLDDAHTLRIGFYHVVEAPLLLVDVHDETTIADSSKGSSAGLMVIAPWTAINLLTPEAHEFLHGNETHTVQSSNVVRDMEHAQPTGRTKLIYTQIPGMMLAVSVQQTGSEYRLQTDGSGQAYVSLADLLLKASFVPPNGLTLAATTMPSDGSSPVTKRVSVTDEQLAAAAAAAQIDIETLRIAGLASREAGNSGGSSGERSVQGDGLAASASQAFQANDFRQAAQLFEQLVATDQRRVLAWYFLGQARQSTGDISGAIAAYRSGIAVSGIASADGVKICQQLAMLTNLHVGNPGQPQSAARSADASIDRTDPLVLLAEHQAQVQAAAQMAAVMQDIQERQQRQAENREERKQCGSQTTTCLRECETTFLNEIRHYPNYFMTEHHKECTRDCLAQQKSCLAESSD